MTEIEVKDQQPKTSFTKEVLSWIKVLSASIVIALIITMFFRTTIVSGDSMRETFHNGDLLALNHMAYQFHDPKRGDIVVFNSNTLNELLIKRVIGEAGDLVTIKEGKVYINNNELDEPYLHGIQTAGNINEVVPEGKVFVMGDNRGNSLDSRFSQVGLVDVDDILGKEMFSIYPLKF